MASCVLANCPKPVWTESLCSLHYQLYFGPDPVPVEGGGRNIDAETIDDLVLLDTISGESVVNVLRARYAQEDIYTYIGPVLVALNPYKLIHKGGEQIYSPKFVKRHDKRLSQEVPPHIFSIAETAFRSLVQDRENQCVIISGESGAGKTEASKHIMQYIAAVSGRGDSPEARANSGRVKEQLLQSNTVLESFGNAQTLRNNNSSRFGKYMALSFDFKGEVVGGFITNYLLEKSRVCAQTRGERSFHIFYMMMAGASQSQRQTWALAPPQEYEYLARAAPRVPGFDDVAEFAAVQQAMDVVGISGSEANDAFQFVSAVLRLGNVAFDSDAQGSSCVRNPGETDIAARLLGVDASSLARVLCSRTLRVGTGRRMSVHVVPLDEEQAVYTRDSLAKALYEKLFCWLVQRINASIAAANPAGGAAAAAAGQRGGYGGGYGGGESKQGYRSGGYGGAGDGALGMGASGGGGNSIGILDIYGFEIFEHNSFEQLCINYVNEKLQQVFIELTLKAEQEEYAREGVPWQHIDYFNNQIVCDLIESKRNGLFGVMDEQCALSEPSDDKLLTKLHQRFGSHGHYTQPRMAGTSFTIVHYAGEVEYDVNGFLEKNKDTLFNDLLSLMATSASPLMAALFTDNRSADEKRHRPPTATTQFKQQVNLLMSTLTACAPHYVRCIKPNEVKRPGAFEQPRVLHQVQYLGLVENVRVRRAGFCYRATYPDFYRRYHCLSALTWPHFKGGGGDRAACEALLCDGDEVQRGWGHTVGTGPLTAGDDYILGTSKVFIRHPATLFALENMRRHRVPLVATSIQAMVRRVQARCRFLTLKAGVQRLQSLVRMHAIRRQYLFKLRCVTILQAAWKGLQYRRSMDPQQYQVCRFAALTLRSQFQRYMGSKQRNRHSLNWSAEGDYLAFANNPNALKLLAKSNQTLVKFADFVHKLNRKQKLQQRIATISDDFLYNLKPNVKSPKQLRAIPIQAIGGLSLSPYTDNYLVVHVPSEYDYVFVAPRKIEMVTILRERFRYHTRSPLPVSFGQCIEYQTKDGPHTLQFTQESADAAAAAGQAATWTVFTDKTTAVVHVVPPPPDAALDGEQGQGGGETKMG